MMMVVGKKQVGDSWHPKLMNQTQLKLRQLNPIRATATATTRKLVAIADNLSTYSPKVGIPFILKIPHSIFYRVLAWSHAGVMIAV